MESWLEFYQDVSSSQRLVHGSQSENWVLVLEICGNVKKDVAKHPQYPGQDSTQIIVLQKCYQLEGDKNTLNQRCSKFLASQVAQ